MKTGYDIPLLAEQIEKDIRNWAIAKGYHKNHDSLLSVNSPLGDHLYISIIDEYWSEKLDTEEAQKIIS